MTNFAAMFFISICFTAVASAVPSEATVPEIDPGSVVTASALIGTGLMMCRKHRK